MALDIKDIIPQPFKVTIKGVELECQPPRLSHTLIISKVGEVFNNIKSASRDDVVQAEKDFDFVVSQLIPELKDVQLDMNAVIELITQIMEQVAPEETKELNQKGVKFDTDPKAERTGL